MPGDEHSTDRAPDSPAGGGDGTGSNQDERDWRDQYLDEELAEHEDDDGPVGPGRAPMSRLRHGSLGVTLGAAMTGLGNVLEPRKKEEAPVVVEHDEPDQSQEPIELRLDRDDPGASVVIIHKRAGERPPPTPLEQ